MALNSPWTREQAIEMSRRAIETKKLRGITGGRPRKKPAENSPQLPAPTVLELPAGDFESLTLSRVRAHVHNLHQVISTEETRKRPDAQRLHWLCKSLAELSELERRLAGRPLPGSRRPPPDYAPRPSTRLAPPVARPMPRAEPVPPSPAADELDTDDEPPLAQAPLD